MECKAEHQKNNQENNDYEVPHNALVPLKSSAHPRLPNLPISAPHGHTLRPPPQVRRPSAISPSPLPPTRNMTRARSAHALPTYPLQQLRSPPLIAVNLARDHTVPPHLVVPHRYVAPGRSVIGCWDLTGRSHRFYASDTKVIAHCSNFPALVWIAGGFVRD
ncbi:hypothetical protein K458DRAFT_415083 [Lentithecium fluviatile CBS 122367]|uniref:Uncharacterized protein n=1 Tax=Lentithecium fluviatile CBS 122367 TaxID=1168545 RepID=A0A6G1JCR4_9PLEO|nr:hypothetical protein K458DRAFT_415083 [Lentithecium fluviatile CBS 122367]